MLLAELVRSDSDRELESALRAAISARKAGSVTTIGFNQLAKMANINTLTKSAFDSFIEKHPELAASIDTTSDNGVALADPSKEPEVPEVDLDAEPADDSAEPAGAENPDLSLAPDAMDTMGGPDLMAGTNTGAPLTPDSRVAPDQGNGAKPHPQEYNAVQKAAQRALGRRS